MSDAAKLIIGLRYGELGIHAPYKLGLEAEHHGYESPDVWLCSKVGSQEFAAASLREDYSPDNASLVEVNVEKESDLHYKDETLYYYPNTILGFEIAGTWNGYIDVEEKGVKERIASAKAQFKKLTGKEAHTIFISTQN